MAALARNVCEIGVPAQRSPTVEAPATIKSQYRRFVAPNHCGSGGRALAGLGCRSVVASVPACVSADRRIRHAHKYFVKEGARIVYSDTCSL